MKIKQLLSLLLLSLLASIYSHTAAAPFEKEKFLICNVSQGSPGERSATSDVLIFKEQNVVSKHVRSYLEFNVFDREVEMLMRLRNFKHVPKILAVDFEDNTIYMEYAGERLTKDNLPANWENQVKDIINGLRALGIQHNDIKNAEVLVKNGTIMVVDYGWASKFGQPTDPSWPSGLGASYKAPWGFDDRFSIIKAILTAKNNGISPSNDQVEAEMNRLFGPR
ncbi:MAG TPA: hypothetical protein VEL47_05370 [Myxococcota bacterium]|nr:hypothetical protein [Myxococcota bacterium]